MRSLPERFRYAFRGLQLALRRPELVLHVVLGLFVVAFGALVCLAATQWALILLAIGLVLVTETLNTSIEELGTLISPRRRDGVRRAKDLAAAAVLLAALTAVALGLFVFLQAFLAGTAGSCHL